MSNMAKREPESGDVVREYGPFIEGETVHGVSFDGQHVWFATGEKLRAFDPADGHVTGELHVACDAGTAFDGTHLYQLAAGRIQKVDPKTGKVVATLPYVGEGDDAGLTWAEGKLWIAKHHGRKIVQIDPTTGTVLRTLSSNRYVTGVTWTRGELWHATLEDGESELRRVDPESSEVLARLTLPSGTRVTGLESDGRDLFYCGGGSSGKVRAVRRPR